MRKAQKRRAEDFLTLLDQAHQQIKKDIEARKIDCAMTLLEQCQQGAVELGNMIEREEGEECITIPLFQSYCELVYQIYESLRQNQGVKGKNVYKRLRKALIQIQNSINNDIKVRMEAVFLPYKASMWDSMESVWMAANADPEWDAFVVPIPYYERNKDKSFGPFHYEGEDFPDNVPVTSYKDYHLKDRKPDVIYIHNPYDQSNYVTSVDPAYYSGELKKHTDCLIYIPYYVTAGGMSEGQSLCMSYFHVDYIVVQAKTIIDFFDLRIPREKFLPLGSPKFDKVLRLCQNPPPVPTEWREKTEGRKVYFYNTSIQEMLGDTDVFLKKMEYVFACFKKQKNACLLWRPHPLLEITFNSMRNSYYPRYKELKQDFLESGLGIYDDTPDIAKTISLCDAYIGDAGTSVISLFGISGKPIFILNDNFYTEPGPEDWRGQIIGGFQYYGNDQWMITQGDKLYYSPCCDYRYEYYCDLSEYSRSDGYLWAVEIGKTVYACPQNAQDIVAVKDRKIVKRIPLEHCLNRWQAFSGALRIGQYLFLIPDRYPYVVRYDTERDRIDYLSGFADLFFGYAEGERLIGGSCVWKNCLFLSSPVDSRILAIDADTMEAQILDTGAGSGRMYLSMGTDGTDIWLTPYFGTSIIRWNPETGELHEYCDVPKGFLCKSQPYGHECLQNPYGTIAFYKNLAFIAPFWGNMYLCLNKDTGEMTQWKLPFETLKTRKNGYYSSGLPGYFISREETLGPGTIRYFSRTDCRLFDVNLETNQWREINVEFNEGELRSQEPGFWETSPWLPYSCQESCFNTLPGFLNGKVTGHLFDRERQLRAYRKIAANYDGTSGEEIHRFVCRKNGL